MTSLQERRVSLLMRLVFSFFLYSCCTVTTVIPAMKDDSVSEQASQQLSDTVSDNDTQQDLMDVEDDTDQEGDYDDDDQEEDESSDDQGNLGILESRIIKNIFVEGNNFATKDAILNRVPYQVGERFEQHRTRQLIRNIHALNFFKRVHVYGEDVGDDGMNLYIQVEEKPRVAEFVFSGNTTVSAQDIQKKFDYESIQTCDEYDLKKLGNVVRKLYREKDFHDPIIETRLEEQDGCVTACIDVQEGQKSLVKRVLFEGNCAFTGKALRKLLYTREDWVFGFLNKAGSYQPEAIEADRQVIENFYQSNGYINAKVADVTVNVNDATKEVFVTFHIYEGELYTINEVKVAGNELVAAEAILQQLPIKAGDLYSKEKIRQSIEMIRDLWGDFGYIYADIEPSIEPNDDDKTVAVGFYSELGNQMTLNRINIYGNLKTRDKVIRRQLVVYEGGLLTQRGLDASKNRVELLGFFEPRDGVNWKMNRIDKQLVDVDLMLKEIKTGKFEGKIGFGGSPRDFSSPAKSFTVQGSLSETNLLGTGIQTELLVSYAKQERSINFNITEPWLFDKPIHTSFDVYHKRSLYEDFKQTKEDVHEQLTGGSATLGFIARRLDDTKILLLTGVEGIHYTDRPESRNNAGGSSDAQKEFQLILDRRFIDGQFIWAGNHWSQDFRNSPIHASRGYQWFVLIKGGASVNPELSENNFGFVKWDMDASWYTPLIGERDLVLCLHGHFGWVTNVHNRSIPFRELYHVGGPASVRGFLFGQIGPRWLTESIGAKKAGWFNAELIFPLASDLSIKGAVFYDGGAGWDSPDKDFITSGRLINNRFDYRHAIGVGVRMLSPTPMKIDWGLKLDPRKGEPESEFHLSMYHEF